MRPRGRGSMGLFGHSVSSSFAPKFFYHRLPSIIPITPGLRQKAGSLQ